jgi:pyrophosphatase PpaX
MPITALIFDMDGTLGDTIPSIVISFRETFAHFTGRLYSDAQIFAMFGPSEEGVIARCVPADLYEPAMQDFLERYARLHAAQPFPGIRDLMASLKARGMRIGVATGKGPRTAAISMRAYGLAAYIDQLETGSAQGAIKPEQIRRVLNGWGLPASQAAYIGDASSDMDDARVTGVLPIGAAWSQSASVTESDTPFRFTSVEALKTWLETLDQ